MTTRGGAAGAAPPPAAGGPPSLTAAEVAEATGGRLSGDPSVVVRAVAPLDRAGPGSLSFLGAARFAAAASAARASVVLVTPALAETPMPGVAARVVVAEPADALLAVLPRLYAVPVRQAGVHPTAVLGAGVTVPADAAVGPYAVIGDGAVLGARVTVHAHAIVGPGVPVGDDSEIGPHVVLHPGTVVGARVRIRAGARIGDAGFKYVFRDGRHEKLPHVGRCVLEDDVEVGANACIDRGSIDDTVIGAGSKLDNLVHVAHNVRLGRLCLVMAQVGIAGSARIGDGVILAGQVGVADRVEIGDRAVLAAQTGATGPIPAGETWSGFPARPHREQMRGHAALRRLTTLLRPLERLLGERGAAGDA